MNALGVANFDIPLLPDAGDQIIAQEKLVSYASWIFHSRHSVNHRHTGRLSPEHRRALWAEKSATMADH
jgi:hypothetical protein